MNRRHIIPVLVIAGTPALMANGCVPSPGWEGAGQIIELEHIAPERDGDGIDSNGFEVTVLLPGDREGNAMFAPTLECQDALRVGQTVTLAQVVEVCGPADWSDDD